MKKLFALLLALLFIAVNISSITPKESITAEENTNTIPYDDWQWYKYEGNPIWGSTNISDTFLATDWIHLSNIGNITWGANYDIQAFFNATTGMLEWQGVMDNLSINNIQSEASYIIWKEGNTYYAMNGTTELIEFSGTNASWVINQAINSSKDGGIVYLKSGKYWINYPVKITQNVSIYGDGPDQTIIYAMDNYQYDRMIGFYPPEGSNYFHTLHGFRLEGRSSNQTVIMSGILNPPSDTLIDWVWVYDVRGYGLKGTNTWSLNVRSSSFESCSIAQIYLYNPKSVEITGCMIASAKYPTVSDGIEICCTREDASCVDISHTTIREVNDGIVITQLKHSNIHDCYIRDVNDYAIEITGHVDYPTEYINIHDNVIWNCANGIRINDEYCRYVKISHNILNNISGTVLSDAGTNTIIEDNIGYISPQDTEFTASYVIFTDGSTYYAQNGTSGLIDFSGTNASWVIQSAIDALPSSGGEVFIKEGEYTIPYPITLKSYVVIEGVYRLTTLKLANNANCYIFQKTTTDDKIEYTTIKNLILDGNYNSNTGGGGIYLYNPEYCLIENVVVQYTDDDAIKIDVNVSAFPYLHLTIRNCYLKYGHSRGLNVLNKIYGLDVTGTIITVFDDYGFYFNAGSGKLSLIDCWISQSLYGMYLDNVYRGYFIGNRIEYNDRYGLYYYRGWKSIFIGNIFRNNAYVDANYSSVYVYNSNQNIFVANSFIDTRGASAQQDYGIEEAGTSDENIIALNHVFGNTVAGVKKVGSNTVVYKNYGYTTSNSGSYEITGDGSTTSFTISHGLDITPDGPPIIIPTNASMASADWYVSAWDSSTFTITFTSAPASGTKLSFYWYYP